jgi:thiol-disulfide isomerase/thioredoxin
MRFFLVVAALAAAVRADVIPEVRASIAQNQFAAAERTVEAYQKSRGATPELIEAVSWLARGAVARKQYDAADRYAKQVMQLAAGQLPKQGGKLDAEPHLPTAVGAAIEVQGLSMAGRGERDQAVAYLRTQVKQYYSTSIRTRIQKNLNLLSLEGKPLPALSVSEFIGPKPTVAKGKPVFLFFWAHWCGDCKGEVPVLEKLKKEYGTRVAFLAPTQHYGYVAGGEDASRPVETKYIENVRNKFYAGLLDVPVPMSEENFKAFGSSTTPTLVLADRAGIVRMYHPGAMTEGELRAQFDAVLKR